MGKAVQPMKEMHDTKESLVLTAREAKKLAVLMFVRAKKRLGEESGELPTPEEFAEDKKNGTTNGVSA